MGTNYYLRTQKGKICDSCNRGDSYEELHIGKSSAGWEFIFNPNSGETPSFKKWRSLLEKSPDQIYDEYDRKVDLFELYTLILSKSGGEVGDDTIDSEGYRISKYSDFC
jgi:hypothetical protein